jgi:PucR C-terminal helix-turn-helix domain
MMIDSQDDRRSALVRGLLEGTLPLAEASAGARAHGLLPGGRYYALRARSVDAHAVNELSRAIAATGGSHGRGVLVTAADDDVLAVVSARPQVPAGCVAGLGSIGPLSALASSFGLATRALDTALAYGIEGVADIDELSLRPAILREPHLGERMINRYIAPLTKAGSIGETLPETLHEYLACGMRVHDAAEALYIHPNTLRYRLERFQEITGADLNRTQDVLELWWALERHRLEAALNREG